MSFLSTLSCKPEYMPFICHLWEDVNRNDVISFFVAARRRIYGAICGPITADPAGEIPTLCIPEKLKET